MLLVKVLILEDEAVIAQSMAIKLRRNKYEVILTSRGEEALEYIRSELPDVAIIDINLQDKRDGIEIAFDIKRQSNIPIIYLTNLEDTSTLKRAAATNPSSYLLKPFNERQMMASISEAIYSNALQTPPIEAPIETKSRIGDEAVSHKYLYLRKDKNSPFKKVLLDQILYIEAERAYSVIHTVTKDYIYSISMNHVNEQINNPSFIQVHRSFIVNSNHVEEIKGNILIVGTVEIPIGVSYKEEVMSRFSLLK